MNIPTESTGPSSGRRPLLDEGKMDEMAAVIRARKKRSQDWLEDNYYEDWEKVWQGYKCVLPTEGDRDIQMEGRSGGYLYDANGRAIKPARLTDKDYEVAMPDLWGLIRRQVARLTAQVPNLRYKTSDREVARAISLTLMYQWGKGGTQLIRKRRVTQAALFGIDFGRWYWYSTPTNRKRRVSLDNASPSDIQLIVTQYLNIVHSTLTEVLQQDLPNDPAMLTGLIQQDEELAAIALSSVLDEVGGGRRIPIQYNHYPYVGPKSDFLFVGDCFPEPDFQTLQSSNWFIVEQRRGKRWFAALVSTYKNDPAMVASLGELFRDMPNGSAHKTSGSDGERLRARLKNLIRHVGSGRYYDNALDPRVSSDTSIPGEDEIPDDAMWTVLEMHTPSPDGATVEYLVEDKYYLGRMESPYDLEDGQIPFTELRIIDDILCGIGDSHARVVEPLQRVHSRNVNSRYRLVHNLTRPLMWTTNEELYTNPDLVARGDGMRLIRVNFPNDIGIVGDQAASAGVVSSLNDESSVMRMIQYATGESNMSMMADVDPKQSATATGARLMQATQDILTKDAISMVDMGVRADAEMMRMLNRSELDDDQQLEVSEYLRNASTKEGGNESYVTVKPDMFDDDGTVEPESGSYLADDDPIYLQKAVGLLDRAMAAPTLFNVNVARDKFLRAMGERNLQEWQPEQQGDPALTPEHQAEMEELRKKAEANEIKRSITLSIKYDELPAKHQGLLADAVIRDLEGVVPAQQWQTDTNAQPIGGIEGTEGMEGMDSVLGTQDGELPPEIMEQLMAGIGEGGEGG